VKRTVYQILATVFGVVLILVGIGALAGANFAHGYVHDQLSQEQITMPGGPALESRLRDGSKEKLEPFAGQPMTTGPQAEAYANNFIYDHMLASCGSVTDANGNPVEPIPADKCTYAGIGDVANAARDAGDTDAQAAYNAARDSNFRGSTLRSMLLTAYGFSILGAIAKWVGIGALVVGALLLVLRFTVLNKPETAPAVAKTSTGRGSTPVAHE